MLIIYILASSLLIIIIAYGFKTSLERYLLLKLIINYLISSTAVFINDTIPIPIGFIFCFIFSCLSNQNKLSKKIISILGLINLIICVILYRVFHPYFFNIKRL